MLDEPISKSHTKLSPFIFTPSTTNNPAKPQNSQSIVPSPILRMGLQDSLVSVAKTASVHPSPNTSYQRKERQDLPQIHAQPSNRSASKSALLLLRESPASDYVVRVGIARHLQVPRCTAALYRRQ